MNRKRALIATAVTVLMLLILVGLAQGKSEGPRSQLVTVSQIASSDEDVAIPRDGGWATVSIPIADAPEGAVVTGLSVKYLVVNADPASLEAQLVAGDGGASHALSAIQPTMKDGKAILTSQEIQALNGTPVNTTWALQVRADGANEGAYVDAVSVKVSFETSMPVLRQSEGPQGEPALFRLPPDHPSAPSADEDVKTP
jgi:hypothetical protein